MTQTTTQSTLETIIKERRAIKKGYTDKPVTEEVVLDLLEKAKWAPNHGMRQPWGFIFVGPEQKEVFAKRVAATYPTGRQADREAYLNEPNAFLIVTIKKGLTKKQHDENFGATASLIQNFWLLAWEQKLGMCWKTNPHIYDERVRELLDIPDDEDIIGFLHMGYFDEVPAKNERTPIKDKFSTFIS